jgi:hypothetical protein
VRVQAAAIAQEGARCRPGSCPAGLRSDAPGRDHETPDVRFCRPAFPRRCQEVIPESSETAGVSRSAVSREGRRNLVPQDHGLPGSVGPQSDPRWVAASHPAGGAVR